MKPVIYELPDCVQCMSTKRHFDRLGIEYEVRSFEDEPDKAREFIEMGYKTAPIVVAGDKIWSGYRHSEIVHYAQTHSKKDANETTS